jgi:hypothetical protein
MNHDENCLHCQINKSVERHIEDSNRVDVADIATKMVESLADLILVAAPRKSKQACGRIRSRSSVACCC